MKPDDRWVAAAQMASATTPRVRRAWERWYRRRRDLTTGLALLLGATALSVSAAGGPQWVPHLFYWCALLALAGAAASERLRGTQRFRARLAEVENDLGHDLVTGLANAAGFEKRLRLIWGQAQREERTVALMYAEVDDAARYRQIYGPAHLDAALRGVALAFQRSTARRPLDSAARLSDTRFAFLCFDTDVEGLKRLVQEFRSAVEALQIEHRESPLGRLSMGCGAALGLPSPDAKVSVLFEAAEDALAEAVQRGRNMICINVVTEKPAPAKAPAKGVKRLP